MRRLRMLAVAVAAASLVPQVTAAIAERQQPPLISSQAAIPTERLSNVPCVDGLADVFPCENMDLLSFIPKAEFGIELSAIAGISEAWGWVDEENGDEYAIFGVTNGVHFVRVTDPMNPEHLGRIPNTAAAQLVWYDMKIANDHLYFGSESAPHDVRVMDLSKLRGATANANGLFIDDGRYGLNVSSHNVVVNEETNRLYLVGGNIGLVVPDQCAAGLVMMDISNPILPTNIGCWDGDAYIHDAQCVVYNGPDTEHVGKEICIGSNEDTMSVIDVTDAANPSRIGLFEYEDFSYTHQGWISEDHKTFYLGDEGDEADFSMNTRTLIVDLTDLDNPTEISQFLHETASIDHNMYIRGNVLTQSNYTSGLRVFDITNSADTGVLEPLGFFDVYPDDDSNIFAGTWGHYPFPSGNMAITSGDEGFFMVRFKEGIELPGYFDAAAPAVPAPAPTTAPAPEPEPTEAPAPAPEAEPAGSNLPATGGGLAIAGLGVAALGAFLRRRD